MVHHSLEDTIDRLDRSGTDHLELFDLEGATVEVGRYPAGDDVPKNPHTEDEIYQIVSGAGKIRVGDETHAVGPGDIVYVERGVEHDFFDVDEEIVALITFLSAEPSSYSIRETEG